MKYILLLMLILSSIACTVQEEVVVLSPQPPLGYWYWSGDRYVHIKERWTYHPCGFSYYKNGQWYYHPARRHCRK